MVQDLRYRVQSLYFRVYKSRVKCLWLRVKGIPAMLPAASSHLAVWGLGLGFRVQGSGFRV
jgi:hypothetical protein